MKLENLERVNQLTDWAKKQQSVIGLLEKRFNEVQTLDLHSPGAKDTFCVNKERFTKFLEAEMSLIQAELVKLGVEIS